MSATEKDSFRAWKQRDADSPDPIGWAEARDEILAAERAEMAARRGVAPPKGVETAGLAISGGGIRSATFALGVLQALGARKLVSRFDYLSTVSGGGYLGASLSWFLSRHAEQLRPPQDVPVPFGLDADDFPFGTEDPEADRAPDADEGWQAKLLRYLRAHGNYLTPDSDITLLSGISVVLRGMIVSLGVWLPVVTAVFVAFFVLDGSIEEGRLDWSNEPKDENKMVVSLWLGLGLLGVFALACLVYAVSTFFARVIKQIGWSRYRLRRGFERWAGLVLKATLALLVLASLRFAAGELKESVEETGALSLVLGALAAIPSFTGGGNDKSRLPLGVVAGVGAVLLIYGLLLLAYGLAGLWYDGLAEKIGLGVALGVGLLVGFRSNLNYIGLHRFYRDRLMETFLPAPADGLANRTGPARDADAVLLSDLKLEGEQPHRGPYHLINTNLVLVDSPRPRLQLRGGDSFVLSPRFCGSDATGYRRTEEFAQDSMALATAMAISGAAAHPNTGVGGVGPMRQKAVAVLMNLLQVRLGYWIPHPRRAQQRSRTPSHFLAMVYQIAANGYTETSRNLEISDGGHFENLGIYELVRRRCKFILAIDGAADPGFAFGDLRIAAERVSEDFPGVRIDFDDGHLEKLIPSGDEDPIARATCAEQGFAVGRIRYDATYSGTIVYVKSTFLRGLSLRLRGYRRAHETYPDESTADQFFDESQFEAYRRLGYAIGAEAAGEIESLLPREWWRDGAAGPSW